MWALIPRFILPLLCRKLTRMYPDLCGLGLTRRQTPDRYALHPADPFSHLLSHSLQKLPSLSISYPG
jgi:hypothetical protein